ncbi:lipopolysaccharide biosynthesis protein [Sphingosinicella sp. CPCC 101087]|uniref:lipopolysaccharide biosynthesis protein n=1 Tax=Sphingosinicella sp. CPCC 101087 TaxID=2497754 RepID=UPI00101DDC4B|nr:lipopolysaccharide biosynthesis protein [Sphingosinicella sp. CPCC 101087]
MPDDPGAAAPAVTRGEVARGAGLAGLSRAGALIEALAQPLYIWMFGLAGYGIYVALWGAVSLLTNLLDLSMTSALQRVVPTRESEALAHGAVKLALLATVLPATAVAAVVSLNAEAIAPIFSAAPADAARLPTAIALFIWALPLWTFIEVATSAVRARRAFGPEIRLRIFWEQLARLAFAAGFFAMGFQSIGLMAAHLSSLFVTALLCLPLLARYYDVRTLLHAPLPRALALELIGSGMALLPANLSRRMLIDAPPLLINFMLPGARGAAASGIFEIARKLSTVPYIVRQAFQYVLGPLSSAQAHADRAAIAPLYEFASRVSTALVIPLAGLLVFTGADVLSVYRREAMAALPLLALLSAARAAEAIVGPAATIVEMTGHRALPLLNSLLAFLIWIVLALWLTPSLGAMGMAIAVSAAVLASTWAAAVELRVSDGLSPFGRKLFQGLAVALVGVAAMALVEHFTGGPLRFALNLAIWAATSWLALRYGLTREERLALGGVARRLRLV